jgi:Protein of unknown function (DUF2917)
MIVNTKRLVIQLERRETARMKDVVGTRIDCLSGCIWITEHGLQDDQVLEAGESHIISRNGVAVVQALSEAAVGIRSPVVRRAGIMAWVARSFRPRAPAREVIGGYMVGLA